MLKKNYQAIWLTGQPAMGKVLANYWVQFFGDNNVFNIDGDDLETALTRTIHVKVEKQILDWAASIAVTP